MKKTRQNKKIEPRSDSIGTEKALAIFCTVAALIFHLNLQDRTERTSFLKDLALAGALVLVSTNAIRSRTVPRS